MQYRSKKLIIRQKRVTYFCLTEEKKYVMKIFETQNIVLLHLNEPINQYI